MRIEYPKLGILLLLSMVLSCQGSKKMVDNDAVDSLETIQREFKAAEDYEIFARNLESRISDYKGSRTRDFDLLHTALDLSFDYKNEWVKGEAVLTLKPHFFSQYELVLDAQDFDIHEFSLLEDKGETPLNYRYETQKIVAFLPKVYEATDTLTVKIKYTAKPNESPGGGSAAITDTKGLYFINASGNENKPVQIWTQGETEHNSKWFPTLDTPNEKATQEIRLTVDQKYRTISNGVLKSKIQNGDGTRTDHWVMDLPHSPYLAAVVIGEFAEIVDKWEDTQVNYYVEKEFEEGAKKVFQNTPEMIAFFSEILGVKYPWQKYDQVVVRDFVSGAMENTTLSVFMEALNLDAREAIDSEWDGIIAHELFHQWFGNYVTTESWANLALNEAFANYSEYLWYEYKEGRDDADLHHVSEMEVYLDESTEKQVDLIRFYHEDSEEMFDSHSYAKGGRILHMLRRHLGDEAFFKSLNHYLVQHAFSTVEVHDLRLAFEKVTGQDLNWFFNQWFLNAGHPILEYVVDYSQPENLLLTITQTQDLKKTPLYKIPFKVSWYQEGERQEKEFVLDKKKQQFAIENQTPVKTLFFDEAKELLSEKKSARGKAHFITQFGISELGIARYEALDSLGSNYAEAEDLAKTFGAALQDPFWSIREMALMQIAKHPEWQMEIIGLEARLLEMAENDPKNTVKSAAIEVLAALDPDKYSPSFLRWMQAPSYYVAGAALSAYLENENNLNRREISERFEQEKNVRMLVALAEYYIEDSVDLKGDWFHEKLLNLSGQSLYYFLGYFGDYFSSMPSEGTADAIEKLYAIGSKEKENYVRVAAFQSLFGFIDEPGVLAKTMELFQNEKDELAKRYMEFYLTPYLDEKLNP
ncbi:MULTISPECIES: M1 family metallopeptidase [Rhodonellum]|nr:MULTISPECIES: M1 family metallopeptidase [Rhodonellum]SDY74063.1 aminopeptidase N [Rhodonellum ikkaensis]